jgi:hypothetical protein
MAAAVAALCGSALSLALVAPPAGAVSIGSTAPDRTAWAAGLGRLSSSATRAVYDGPARPGANSAFQSEVEPTCTFNGQTDIVPNVSPSSSVAIVCTGWEPDDQIVGGEISPLALATGSDADSDVNDLQSFTSDGSGNLSGTFVVPNPFVASDPAAVCPPTAAQVAKGFLRCGLLLADQDGNAALVAFDYAGAPQPSAPTAVAVGMAATPDGGGYWLAWSNGNVTVHGNAQSYGNASQLNLNQPITHIVSTPDGKGYWLVASDGGIFAFGAPFFGSTGSLQLNRPVNGMAATTDGKGYWLVASDGGIFAFGNAGFYGSMGGTTLNVPIVGMANDDTAPGYWLVGADGGIFAFGGAPFFGSA